MSDYRKQYWRDALGEALSSAGCFNCLSYEQINEVADSLSVSAEMQGEATGAFAIPNPWIAERARIEQAHKRELDAATLEAKAYKEEACRIAGVDPHKVWTRDGEVWRSR